MLNDYLHGFAETIKLLAISAAVCTVMYFIIAGFYATFPSLLPLV